MRTGDGRLAAKLALASGVSSVVLFVVWFWTWTNADYLWTYAAGTAIAAVVLGSYAAMWRRQQESIGHGDEVLEAVVS